MNNLLLSREYKINGNWYAPEKYLKNFKSVVKADLTNTCSSAGDWDGYFIQKIGNISYFILFGQSNNWPRAGFTLSTDDHVTASCVGDFNKEDIENILLDVYEYYE